MTERIAVTVDAPSVMIVDDHPENLQLLDTILRDQGLRTSVFPSGALALRAAERRVPDLVLLDINMPDMDGYEVCRRFKASLALRDTPIIFLSALAQPEDRVRGFESGGVDFVGKPFNMAEVQARVATHLELRRARTSLHMRHLQLQSLVDMAASAKLEARVALLQAVASLAGSPVDDDPHRQERARIACEVLVGKVLASGVRGETLTAQDARTAIEASTLHDLGMASIDEAVLLKPGRLDEAEVRLMQQHTCIGQDLLVRMSSPADPEPVLAMGAVIARSHHERWDGLGYPDGLAGEDIPLVARIVATADTYDAIHSPRRYRDTKAPAAALEEFRATGGTQLDPQLVALLLDGHAEIRARIAALV